jgi:hypothetical protein
MENGIAKETKAMVNEEAIVEAERKWVGKRVFITRGHYAGHWGVIASADSEDSFIVRGGTLGGLEPIIGREEFRKMRGGEFTLDS